MSSTTRRSFIKTGLAAGALASAGIRPVFAAKRTATDTVVLGRSKLEVTRLAFGTGTNSGEVQAALGQKEFTRLVRYAYDHGIRFFETAEAYVTPGMLGAFRHALPNPYSVAKALILVAALLRLRDARLFKDRRLLTLCGRDP